MLDLSDKKGLVLGPANEESIPSHIASYLASCGAEVAIGCHPSNIGWVTAEYPGATIFSFDALVPGATKEVVEAAGAHLGRLDFMVHGIAFGPPKSLKRELWRIDLNHFDVTMEISVKSYIEMVKAGEPYLSEWGSVIALTFHIGSALVLPKEYELMGVAKLLLEKAVKCDALALGRKKKVRDNAIGAGPISTTSTRVMSSFEPYLAQVAQAAPLGCVTQEDVAMAAAFLVSDMSRRITGHVLDVDAGLINLATVGVPVLPKDAAEFAQCLHDVPFVNAEMREQMLALLQAAE